MHYATHVSKLALGAFVLSSLLLSTPAFAADIIHGQVVGGGAPIARSTVTLWAGHQGRNL
jgi:hypothetical protein